MAFTDEQRLSQSASYLKIIQWTTVGRVKPPPLSQPQQGLAAESIDETTKISKLEMRAKDAAELLNAVDVAIGAEKKKPISENEETNETNSREDHFAEVTEMADAAKRHVEGLARSINEIGIQNNESRNKFRDKIKVLDAELDVIVAATATEIPNLANNIKAEQLRELLMLKPKQQTRAIDDLVKASDPENVLGIKAGLNKFVETAMPKAQEIVEAKLELVGVQKKRLAQLANNVEKSEKDMTTLDREIDVLAQKIKEKLAGIVGAVPALKNRIQSTTVQTRMQMS